MRTGSLNSVANSIRVRLRSPLPLFPQLSTNLAPPSLLVREQHFSDRQRVAAKQQFTKESEAEMKLKEEFAQAQQEKEEKAKAKKSAANTPKVAGVGTPVVKRTPRRFGM